ncbi:MAG: hypothetical protein MUC49_00925 [Raineya sp.]|jgi:hypothetical protein|nr:hypothetical protein [Raineya sp.]
MINLNRYHQLLGVNQNSNPIKIRDAYLEKTKSLHAILNESQEARDLFIEYTEAYEVVSLKMQKKLKSKDFDYDKWMREIKDKCEYYATLDYPSFEKFITEDIAYHSVVLIGSHIVFIFFSLLSILLLILLTLAVIKQKMFFALITFVPIIFSFLMIQRVYPALHLKRFGYALFIMVSSNMFQTTILTLVNFFVFINVGLDTLITLEVYFFIFFVAMIITYGLCNWVYPHQTKNKKYIYTFGLTPFLINFLLLINFSFSKQPVQEVYFYTIKQAKINFVGNNSYENYVGIRFFFHRLGDAEHTNRIQYTFEEGLLGLRVVTSYDFLPYQDVKEYDKHR